MAGRSRVQQRRSPPGGRSRDPRTQAAPGEPSSPEALLALQRSAGNQATAAMLARMENGQDGNAGGGGWGISSYLYSWLEYLGVVAAQAPAVQTTAQQPAPSTTVAQQAPVNTQQAPVNTQQAPVITQQAPVNTPTAPANTQAAPANTQLAPPAPTPTSAPLTAAEKTELRKQLGKLEDTLESLDDKLLARDIRKACRLIEGVLQATTVSDARLTEVNDAIAEVSTAIAKVNKAAQRSTRNTSSSSQVAADEPEVLPVDILVGGTMANRDKWPYRVIVEREMTTMVNGGVWLGSDGTPSLSLGVRGHWQPGDKPPHFIKIYIDEAEMGKRTKMRAYFRYRVVNGHLVIKLVAICEEHRSVEKTIVGNKDDVIGDDGT